MSRMLEVVYEGSGGKIKCGTCSCWLGFEPADHLITAECPTCETPLVVPPQVLSFPEVKKPAAIDLKPKKREAVPLPAFPERNAKPVKEGVVRLNTEALDVVEDPFAFPDRQITPKGQLSLPTTRPSATDQMSTFSFAPDSVPSAQGFGSPAPEAEIPKKPKRRGAGFNPRLQSAPNDGLNEGFAGDVKKGFVGGLQSMAGFLSVLATVMIVSVLIVVLLKQDEPASAETIEIQLPSEIGYTQEELAGQGIVGNP